MDSLFNKFYTIPFPNDDNFISTLLNGLTVGDLPSANILVAVDRLANLSSEDKVTVVAKICYFFYASEYDNFSRLTDEDPDEYASRICQTSESHSYDTARCYGWRCSTGSHSFSDQAAESCTPSFCYLGSNSGSISGWDATCKSWATSDSTSCDSKPNAYICTSSEWISDPVPWSKSIDSSMSGGASNAIITELGCY